MNMNSAMTIALFLTCGETRRMIWLLLDSLQAIGFLQRVFPPVEPFCPVRFPYFYRCYHKPDEDVINVSWKQEAIDLYNSDEILEKILILMGAK